MPPRLWPERVQDIIEAIVAIQTYTAAMDLEDLAGNRQAADAVLYNFAVIGEAANSIPSQVRDAHPEIAWDQARRMRNFVTHVYFAVNLQMVWDTVQNDLPPLREQMRALLAESPDEEPPPG